MRRLVFGLLMIAVAMACSPAGAQSFHAGFTRISIQDDAPFDALIAYPTEAAEGPVAEGPFALSASRDAPIARAARFPIVLFSHGSGRGPGTPLVHRDLLLYLAREGFVVVAPFHPGTAQPLVSRPRQVRKALESVLDNPRFSTHADPARVGMIGFSFGGAVTIIAAGGMANLAHLSVYCREHADPRACDGIPTDDSWAGVAMRTSADKLVLKALVLLEPYGALFEAKGLASLDLPTLIYHASQTDLRPDGNALALAKALPRPPRQAAVPGGHFVFVDPCPPILEAQSPAVCRDPPGIDRAAINQRVRREIADFFRENL